MKHNNTSLNKQITKAVIPAAGLGTRFLPVTKSIPKEMIPIVDIPTIDYIVNEAINSGIKDILIIVSHTKNALIRYFVKNTILEEKLRKLNKVQFLNKLKKIGRGASISFVIQREQNGLGHAISLAEKFVGDDSFAVLLGDDLTESKVPVLKQCINVYDKYHSTVLGVKNVLPKNVSKYGIIKPNKYLDSKSKLCLVKSVIEKPDIAKAPSNLAVCGRYVFTNSIFKYLKTTKPGVGGEIQLTDAILKQCKAEPVYAYNFDGKRYDIGSKRGFIIATIDAALKDNEIRDEILSYINDISSENVSKDGV